VIVVDDVTAGGEACLLVIHVMPTSANKGKTLKKTRKRIKRQGKGRK
jgi:hypothetical protein